MLTEEKEKTEEEMKEEIVKAASILGRKGGKVKSEKKTTAVRENAKKGGRPKKEKA